MKKISVAIAGVGNCASSLVQGLEYYKGRNEGAFAGLMHTRIGDWGPSDIEIVAAFDIDRRKVGSLTDRLGLIAASSPELCDKIVKVLGDE
jgi:myo-inositol-1-phosphate synthase